MLTGLNLSSNILILIQGKIQVVALECQNVHVFLLIALIGVFISGWSLTLGIREFSI